MEKINTHTTSISIYLLERPGGKGREEKREGEDKGKREGLWRACVRNVLLFTELFRCWSSGQRPTFLVSPRETGGKVCVMSPLLSRGDKRTEAELYLLRAFEELDPRRFGGSSGGFLAEPNSQARRQDQYF